jgi:hypothetical protein
LHWLVLGLLGHIILTLYQFARVVSGKQTIVLYGALRHGYLTKDAARDVLDKKAQFSFDTRLVSTIYSTDSAVSQFLRSGSLDVRANSTEVCTALKNLVAETTKGSELVRFLPAVFKQIFMFVACSNAPVRADAFDTLVDVLVRVSEVASADHFLFEAYVKFVFDHETNQMPRYFFDALVEAWVAVIRLGAPRKYHCIVFSQFFLGLVVKSMTLHIARQKNLGATILQQVLHCKMNLLIIFPLRRRHSTISIPS